MVFCGQCGLHLPFGTTRCPRCSTVIDATSDVGIDTFPTDTPTVESQLHAQSSLTNVNADAAYPSTAFTPHEQQKLVLRARSADNNGNRLADDNEPTRVLNGVDYRTQQPIPGDFQSIPSYSSAPQNASYPIQANSIYSNGDYEPTNYVYSGNMPPEGAVPIGYSLVAATHQKKRRTLPILLALLGILLLVGATTFFVVEKFHLLAKADGGTHIGSTTPLSNAERATRVVQQYYANVNNKNYQGAYSLWKWGANAPSFATFERGYANTEHDELTIGKTTQLADGTINVPLTIIATERTVSGVQHHTYTGYYIVGQNGGAWKILRGVLK